MRSSGITFLAALLLVLYVPCSINAQSVLPSTIEGRVVDKETGAPLQGAHVFLSGTKIGTATNPSGRYRLTHVPAGSHRLVISIIGYGRTSVDMVFSPGESKTENIELTPVVYDLGEIYAGNLDERWERHLERFTQLFVGVSQIADSVKILNPEVLRFETRWWGRFTAEALAPLQIENRALGYRITYYLDEFYHSGNVTRWDGEPHFTEMNPVNSYQAEYWRQNRKETFNGSLRHFLISLIEERSREDGFIIYSQPNTMHGYSARNRFRVSERRLIRETDEEHLYHVRFTGRIEVVYTKEGEDPRYVQWARDLYRGPAGNQTSYLRLNKRPITVDTDGEIVETYGATRFGYFAFRRVADRTPREYRPDGF